MNFLDNSFLGNSNKVWLTVIVTIFVTFLIIKLSKKYVLSRLKAWSVKTKTTLDDFLLEQIDKNFFPFLYIASVYFASKMLSLPPKAERIIYIAFIVTATYFMLRIITSVLKQFIFGFIRGQENSEVKEKQAKGLLIIINVIIWILGFVFLIDNLGYNVTTLIAGMGIGGIAIALAAQTILGDLFSYFVIFFDRPFEIGDFISVDDKAGTVEYVGIKTTRIITTGGEQLVCSNTDLTNSRLHNFKKMVRRRRVFTIGVIYQTTAAQLRKIPDIIKQVIDEVEMATYDRSNFSNFGDSSLDFETVYYVEAPDYAIHMNVQQDIFLKLFQAFEEEGIEFAYPTQTLFIEKNVIEKLKSENKNGIAEAQEK